MTVQIQSALLENPAGRFCLSFQKDLSAREGGTVAAATPQRVGKINAALPPDICTFGDSSAIVSPRRDDPPIVLRLIYNRSVRTFV